MFTFIIILFATAASIGGYLLSYVLTNKETPKGVAIVHGLFAAIAIILLAFYSLSHSGLFISLGIFVAAALGGLYLFTRDLISHKIPKPVALGHGLLAVIGLISLIYLGFKFF